jgi:hypothetical protein
MGEVCGMHGICEICIQNSGRQAKRRDHVADLGLDWKIVLKLMMKEICCWVVDWINLAQGSRTVTSEPSKEPSGSRNSVSVLISGATVSFPRRTVFR